LVETIPSGIQLITLMGSRWGKMISLSGRSYREIVLDGFFNLTDPNFPVSNHTGNPVKEIISVGKPTDNCNFSVILSLSGFSCRFAVRIYFSDGFTLYLSHPVLRTKPNA
jgi:hypothetical protein